MSTSNQSQVEYLVTERKLRKILADFYKDVLSERFNYKGTVAEAGIIQWMDENEITAALKSPISEEQTEFVWVEMPVEKELPPLGFVLASHDEQDGFSEYLYDGKVFRFEYYGEHLESNFKITNWLKKVPANKVTHKEQPSSSTVGENVEQEWHCVKDCLPDYDERVLWLLEDGNMVIEDLDKDGNPWLLDDEDDEIVELFGGTPKATHWRKLPPAPPIQEQPIKTNQ